MKVFSLRQIKELESYTIENEPIAAIDLNGLQRKLLQLL